METAAGEEQATAPAPESPVQPELVQELASSAAEEPANAADAAGEAAESIPLAAEEPAYIEVWRPGRPPEERRAERNRQRPRRVRGESRTPAAVATDAASSPEAAAATATPAADAAAAPETQRPDRPPRRGRPHRDRDARESREARGRPDRRERREPRDRHEHSERAGRRDRERPAFAKRTFGERRDKGPDPDSPFAKLAALKEQLEANTKDGR
jgi:ATP-dependent RNA helicase SUPV3L1/SUV3